MELIIVYLFTIYIVFRAALCIVEEALGRVSDMNSLLLQIFLVVFTLGAISFTNIALKFQDYELFFHINLVGGGIIMIRQFTKI